MPWNISATSVAGTSHQAHNTPCQDDYAYTTGPNGLIIIAVADGAGSAPHSAAGATTAVTSAVAYLAGALHTSRPRPKLIARALRETVDHCRATIAQLADRHGHTIHDYATTLLATVVTEHHIGTLQLGDGAIITSDDHRRLTIHTVQQTREYVNDVTFLTSDNYEDELRISIRPRRHATNVALVTDGIESISVQRSTNKPHHGFFVPLFGLHPTPGVLREFVSSRVVCERTDDDKTIIIATGGPS